ncbi:MAG: type III-A CRISPR-associated RAMP protein Csm5 [Haliscomenobacter sp.]|uniref:type III-A CRISPR-associated RAMP protein Csm5 n=1 Tax=Haliscomenobacter sp. TaxID=2717303 RepID=UPI0029AD9ACC|nr:type III-A CRISPR-associated RAMP protein Csm5 [Haliscomenobacter sp.]MDX2070749.1 type III-A CRISPR-associated RAMP protein Csm5 [Haliscomenobacter sp.]
MKETILPIPIYLKTLTPLHVGTGEEMSPLDYVVYDKHFFPLSQPQMMRLVKDFKLEREFADWVQTGMMEMIDAGDDNRALADKRNNLNPYQFFDTKGKAKQQDFLTFLQSKTGQPVRFDEQTARKYQGKKNAVLGQVRAAIKTGADQAAYVPGSTLKGALRTAVFYHFLSRHGDSGVIGKIITEQLNKKARKEQFAQPLIQEAFYCGTSDGMGRYNNRDEKMDLFKLVSFADASLDQRNTPLELAKFNIYLVEKERSKYGAAATVKAAMQPQASYCEAIGSGQTLKTLLNFDIEFLWRIKQWLQKGSVGYSWIGIESKVKKLFNLDIHSLTEQNLREKRDEVIAHLLNCWHQFSLRQRKKQQTWINNFVLNDKERSFPRVQQGFDQISVSEGQYLLHLGYATGFLGTTAVIYFLEDNIANQTLYQRALQRFGIGNRPGNRGDYSLNLERFPKSRRLIDQDGLQVMPGWMALALEPMPKGRNDNGMGPKAEQPAQASTILVETKEIKAEFPTRPLRPGSSVNLDAVVIAPGRPNRVKVYVREGYLPELALQGYRSELEIDSVLKVNAMLNKRGEVVQVTFISVKKSD